MAKCSSCNGEKTITVKEKCTSCNGKGCDDCTNGYEYTTFTCPTCGGYGYVK